MTRRMILCLNPNAAIDKTVVVRSFRLDAIHRPEQVLAIPGGKGCNVARALQRLGETPVISGWVGGYAGEFIESGLRQEGIQTAFVHTDFESRTCLSILDPDSDTLTELYEKGEAVPAHKVDELKEQFRATVGQYATVTLSGSLPTGVPADFFADLITIARAAGVPALLDTSGEALQHGAAARPFLIKPNKKEFTDLVGQDLHSPADVTAAVAAFAAQSGAMVVVSLGAEGAVAADGTTVLHARPPQVDAQSAVGSGDCLLAGLGYGLTRSWSLEQALITGVAAGAANTLRVGAGNFTLEDFERVRSQVTVESV
jgi:tagatose 6-phosphate kinase